MENSPQHLNPEAVDALTKLVAAKLLAGAREIVPTGSICLSCLVGSLYNAMANLIDNEALRAEHGWQPEHVQDALYKVTTASATSLASLRISLATAAGEEPSPVDVMLLMGGAQAKFISPQEAYELSGGKIGEPPEGEKPSATVHEFKPRKFDA